jgi:ribosomal protein S6--L-glutamate ligase
VCDIFVTDRPDSRVVPIAPGRLQDRSPRPASPPRIGIAVEPRYLSQLQPAGLVRALERAGLAPSLIDPDHAPSDALDGLDILVARGRSAALLALLGRAEAAGIPTVNPRAAICAVVDKAAMARALSGAGVPTPATRVGTREAILEGARPGDFPMVVKPVFGDNARGVHVVCSREELARLPWNEPVALAQPFLPSDGDDLKLYVAGAAVWAVKKPSPIGDRTGGPARLVPATAALEALAHRCGRLFGLELFGVDCIDGPHGPAVIEVNDFPNYTGIDGVDERLATHVLERASAHRMERAS